MMFGDVVIVVDDCNCVFRLCAAVRTDELLGCDCYNQPVYCRSLRGNRFGYLAMRWLCCGFGDLESVF